MTVCAIQNTEATEETFADGEVESLNRIREAFEVFKTQSERLQASYDNIKKDLAITNEQLNVKNRALSEKVEELRRMSSRLQCIVDSLTDGVLVVNDDFIVERSNPAAAALLGMPQENIDGKHYDQITNGLGDVKILQSVIKYGKPSAGKERTSVNAAGEKISVLAGVAPIKSGDGVIIGAVEVLRDVTELRTLQERMNCQKRMAALGEMAAGVAHEIRNPLGTIEGFARLLKRDLENQPQQGRLAGKIVEGVQNLNYVITNLLTYAKPMSLQFEEFSINKLMDGVEDVLNERAARSEVNVFVRRAQPVFQAKGDIRQLKQVLLNLGLNAVEACQKGGRVEVSAFKKGRNTVLSVTDDGCGITSGDMQKIFDPFFTKKEGGTGLGLSLCHKIVSVHGGEIMVSSEQGKGSVFEVLLP
ncbi:MAG: hypothetical protein A2283_07170 [Lentisphaerae bacterium RIFOXYA12_FULL_48_11]|nr:MAG: hypothetical protein A2283_07170 [Lentisphaerae bacterium RIFOXYA12_FULL_48_11]